MLKNKKECKKKVMLAHHNYVNKNPKKNNYIYWIRPIYDIVVSEEMFNQFKDKNIDDC
jgi:hypothetical protein